MSDDFENHTAGLTSPARNAAAITPSDTADLASATRALYVGQSGNVRLVTVAGQTVTFNNMLPGVVYPLRVARVLATGTTATGLVALS